MLIKRASAINPSEITGLSLFERRREFLASSINLGLAIGALIPLARLIHNAFTDNLGGNPVEAPQHTTGDWALYLLLATLTVTPLKRLANVNLVRLRRMLGLFCFFYAAMHFSSWLVFDHFFDLNEMVKDIRKRPYITIGFAAFVLLIPLAVTSTNAMLRRLGGARWRKLHSLVYLIGTLVIPHYLFLVKNDTQDPIFLGSIFLVLLMLRTTIFDRFRAARLRRSAAARLAVTMAK